MVFHCQGLLQNLIVIDAIKVMDASGPEYGPCEILALFSTWMKLPQNSHCTSWASENQ